jgi:Transposase domain (DUF772)
MKDAPAEELFDQRESLNAVAPGNEMTTSELKTNWRLSVTLPLPELGAVRSARPRSLGEAVQSAVRAVDESNLRLVARRAAGVAYQPKVLLALLSYCYARQTYGSEDIEDLMRQDGEFRQLCQGEFPSARLLRRFRRENREAVRLCLQGALRFLLETQKTASPASDAALAEEADRRILMAMFIDHMQSDEA